MKRFICAVFHLLKSFSYAGKGIFESLKTQMNLRVHLVALLTVLMVGKIASLTVTHWCVVLLCCMAVISLELVNTALERACDAVTVEQNPLIGQAKDACAGAVLVSAIGSAVIAAVILFGGCNSEGAYAGALIRFFHDYGWITLLIPIYVLLAGVFVFGPYMLQKKNK